MLAGRYALEAELGRSGTGMVWEATDTVLDRTVAVKVLRPAIADDPRFADQLTQEAETAARVSGPGLARLLDSGSDRGVSFLVREHIRGESLRPILRRDGRLPPEVAIPIVVRVLEGLAAAHAAGILHLDVKPENVITDEAGEARLTDLGIGAAVAAADPPSDAAAHVAEMARVSRRLLFVSSYDGAENRLDVHCFKHDHDPLWFNAGLEIVSYTYHPRSLQGQWLLRKGVSNDQVGIS